MMEEELLLEQELARALPSGETEPRPLHRAMRHAVLGGGKRLRPRLLLTVFAACAGHPAAAERRLALRAACAVELLHSASLVHDDLPIFDDAFERRGQPTVHVLYGARTALLAGDALVTLAFELLAETEPELAQRALRIVKSLGNGAGSREGIIGGQSLEDTIDLDRVDEYHLMKTGALFRTAAAAGAIAAGAQDSDSWARIGQDLGLAYQLADDLYDACGESAVEGKPVRRDAASGQPNAVDANGSAAVGSRLWCLLEGARLGAAGLAIDPRPVAALFEMVTEHLRRMTGTRRSSDLEALRLGATGALQHLPDVRSG